MTITFLSPVRGTYLISLGQIERCLFVRKCDVYTTPAANHSCFHFNTIAFFEHQVDLDERTIIKEPRFLKVFKSSTSQVFSNS